MLQEMCCCAAGGGVKRAPGIQGMCHGGKRGVSAPKIEIRLREPGNHSFIDFEYHVVGTMCHELAHIVHGNHSAEFYDLMEVSPFHLVWLSLPRQGFSSSVPSVTNTQVLRNEFDTTRKQAGSDGRGSFLGQGVKADGDRHNATDRAAARRQAVASAEARARKQQLMGNSGGQRLGGGCVNSGGSDDWKKVPPREAALRAAERRMR